MTLLGDATHSGDIDAALTADEAALFSRGAWAAAEAHRILELCLRDRAPFGLVDVFAGAPQGEHE